jgi:hypothetical protein
MFIIIILNMYATAIVNPINKLIEGLKKIKDGNYDEKIEYASKTRSVMQYEILT